MGNTTAPKSLQSRTIVQSKDYAEIKTFVSDQSWVPVSTARQVGDVYLRGKVVGQNNADAFVLSLNPQLARQQAIVREMNARLGGVYVEPVDSTDL